MFTVKKKKKNSKTNNFLQKYQKFAKNIRKTLKNLELFYYQSLRKFSWTLLAIEYVILSLFASPRFSLMSRKLLNLSNPS